MNGNLRKEVLTETYEDLQKLVYKTAWEFWKSHGGDIDDLIAQANLIFIDAFDTYDSECGTELSTWVVSSVWYKLLGYVRKENGDRPHTQIDKVFVETFPTANKNFSVLELIDEMTQDAHIVLRLFFETPRDVVVDLLDTKKRMFYVQRAMQKRLKNRLRQMDWSARRIKEAFGIIKRVINC